MNKTALYLIVIILAAALIGLYIYFQNSNRYFIVTAPYNSMVYKIDRRSGQIWLVSYSTGEHRIKKSTP